MADHPHQGDQDPETAAPAPDEHAARTSVPHEALYDATPSPGHRGPRPGQQPQVEIKGTPDAAHEAVQAERFVRSQGGGTFEFLGSQAQGVDGRFTPAGSEQSAPVSLKNFQETDRMSNIIGRINRNAERVREAGHAGDCVLHVETPQFGADDLQRFIDDGPIAKMPSEGVFRSLVFECRDATIVVDATGSRRR